MKNMRWTKSRYSIHSGRRYLIKSPYWLQFTFVQHNECYCLFWPFNILFLLWLVPATVTYVLFASWTLLAPPTSTLCAVVWDIPAISFQPLLQKCYRECTPLFHFWDTRWQGSVGRPLVSIRPVFFSGAQDHTGEKWALKSFLSAWLCEEHCVSVFSHLYFSFPMFTEEDNWVSGLRLLSINTLCRDKIRLHLIFFPITLRVIFLRSCNKFQSCWV